jgi:predicted DNA-binding transcriptional regulator YafY
MSCDTNQKKAAQAAVATGIPKLASKTAAALNGPHKSPQSKWATLDEAYAKKNAKADRKAFARTRRAFVAKNVKQFNQAIGQQRKVAIEYQMPGKVKRYTLIPLDVKGGLFKDNKHQRYMWGFSEKRQLPLCFRLERVAKVEMLAEAFDPDELVKTWKRKDVKYNLPRDWGQPPANGKKSGPTPANKKPATGKQDAGQAASRTATGNKKTAKKTKTKDGGFS